MTNHCPLCGQIIPNPVGRPVAKTPAPAVSKAMKLVAKGYTQAAAAEEAGCALSTLKRWLQISACQGGKNPAR